MESLKLAIQNRQQDIAVSLLQTLDLNIKDNLICFVAEQGNEEVMELFLKDNYPNPLNQALIRASLNGHHKILKLLLQDGRADPTIVDGDDFSLICSKGYYEVIKLLLEDRRAINLFAGVSHAEAIRNACSSGHADVVELLLQNGEANPCFDDCGAVDIVCHASRNNDSDDNQKILELLLSDERMFFETEVLIDIACRKGYLNLLMIVLRDKRFEVRQSHCLIGFNTACTTGQAKIIKFLLEYFSQTADISAGFTLACLYGHLDVIKVLCEHRKTNTEFSKNKLTIGQLIFDFIIVCQHGHLEIVKFLLEDSGEVIEAQQGFISACLYGHLETVRYLCENKNINKKPGLTLALRKKNLEIIEFLMWGMIGKIFCECKEVLISKDLDIPEDVIRVVWEYIILTEIESCSDKDII